ncbi:GNAT family N-acetyltransferase [Actinoallomurus liliacearum]|uniref:GNAT family N-acetyltransferase n=1 Tax=Actinoallomurus liliacearum TaxID=1080073 RepID=A0ABP8TYU1_9ACTN
MTRAIRPEGILIRPRPYDHPDAEQLVRSLYAEQLKLYGFADPPEADPETFTPPEGLFLVAYVEEAPVACGGMRAHEPSVTEIKKMYVRPPHRGHGLGRRILAELEKAAKEAGATRAILETDARNLEALALYSGVGYEAIASYRDRDARINRALAKALR